jgi:cytochrome c553
MIAEARLFFPMSWLFVLSLALVTLPDSAVAAPPYSRDAEVAKGKQVFQLCSGCHSTESDKKRWDHHSEGSLSEAALEMASLSPRRTSGS